MLHFVVSILGYHTRVALHFNRCSPCVLVPCNQIKPADSFCCRTGQTISLMQCVMTKGSLANVLANNVENENRRNPRSDSDEHSNDGGSVEDQLPLISS